MCGIAGYRTSLPLPEEVLTRMVAALAHRGPDSDGFIRRAGYAAGARRLSINDLVAGDQPLYSEDRSVVLVYNGEIYNSPDLRRELETRGHRFHSRSDGEVICHLYEEHGEDLFERLDGMFAVALWSEKERRLLLARDWPGEKPLHYALLPEGGIAFASEIKSLTLFPGLDLSLDHQALWDFPTFLWIPEPATVYRHVRSLMPGELLVSDMMGIRSRSFRPRSFQPGGGALSDDEAVATTRAVVERAIRSRLLSDVPVGAFLSSGLDSSLVSTVARRSLPELSTFTIGFEDLDDPYGGNADESSAAEALARALGTKHHTVRITAADFRRDLETFCRAGDQPFAVSSGLGILAIARAAREAGIKVLLSGDGADECFGGYPWYFHLGAATRRAAAASSPPDDFSFQNFGVPLDERLALLSALPAPRRAWAWHYYAAECEKRRLFHHERFADVTSSLRFFSAFRPDCDWTPEDFIRQDRGFYFPMEMLRKVDRMTMAYSVESRVPFAAGPIMALAERLSYDQMVRGAYNKWVLRQAFRDILPADVIDRPKHGFNVPIDHWLRHGWRDLVEQAFAPGSALDRGGFLAPGAAAEARRMRERKMRLNGHTIFCMIMLNMWLEESGGRRGA